MKTTTMRATILLVLAAAATHTHGQFMGDTLVTHFEGDGATLALDSVYPDELWQVGAPNKVVFTNAWSEPNVLVTDTLAAYPANAASFAEFTITFDEPGLGLSFRSWVDTEGPGTYGRLETHNPATQEWEPISIYGPVRTEYDYLYVTQYTGPDNMEGHFFGTGGGWEPVRMDAYCLGVFRPTEQHRGGGGGFFVARLRFAFYSSDALAAHDGWMIDDLKATPLGCQGDVETRDLPLLQLEQDVTGAQMTVRAHAELVKDATVSLLTSDGRLIRSERLQAATHVVDVAQLAAGTYLCTVQSAGGAATMPFTLVR